MRSRLFSTTAGHPNLEVNRRPQYYASVPELGGGGAVSISGFIRLLHDLPLAEIGKPVVRALAADIRKAVAEEMAAREAAGELPDVQDVINDVCNLSGLLAAVDTVCAGGRVDMLDVIRASLARRATS